MTLTYVEKNGDVRVVAENVKDETQALEILMKDQARRFIHQTGNIKIKRTPKYFCFENAAGVDSGYRLER